MRSCVNYYTIKQNYSELEENRKKFYILLYASIFKLSFDENFAKFKIAVPGIYSEIKQF